MQTPESREKRFEKVRQFQGHYGKFLIKLLFSTLDLFISLFFFHTDKLKALNTQVIAYYATEKAVPANTKILYLLPCFQVALNFIGVKILPLTTNNIAAINRVIQFAVFINNEVITGILRKITYQ